MKFRFWVVGFRIWGLGFRVSRISSLGLGAVDGLLSKAQESSYALIIGSLQSDR